jgi:hypothetical protein
VLLHTSGHDGVAVGAYGKTCVKADEIDPLRLAAEVSECDATMVRVEGLEVFMAAVGGLVGQGTPIIPHVD